MMEKSYDSAGDHNLKHLNKVSHKISKPIKRNPFDHHHQQQQQQQQQQNQTPLVYNINKCDFREVVQKLTGSPAHDSTAAAAPPIHKPQTSRLHSIRPPPLAHVSTKPPVLPLNNTNPPSSTTTTMKNNNHNGRQTAPLSPLPPFPAVNLVAESPISAYMRYLRSSTSTVDSESKNLSPRWTNPNFLSQQQPQPLQIKIPSPTRIPSPKSNYPLLSSPSSLLFSPTVTAQLGFHQFSPLLSPSWRNL